MLLESYEKLRREARQEKTREVRSERGLLSLSLLPWSER
jgi:hypothetical protein